MAHIVSINTINYSYVDLASKQQLNDFGVVIIYKGVNYLLTRNIEATLPSLSTSSLLQAQKKPLMRGF